MKSIYCVFAAVLCICLFVPAAAQPEVISRGRLLSNWQSLKTVPIDSWEDSLYVVIVEDDVAKLYRKNYNDSGNWHFGYWCPGDIIEFFVGGCGTKYAYSYQTLWYLEDYDWWYDKFCPGRPMADNLENFHVIWDGPGDSLHYGYSTDTLSTFEIEESFIPPGVFVYLVSSPDRYYIAAVFYDYESELIYKYLTEGGQAIDFSGQADSIPSDFSPAGFDLALDWGGDLCFVRNNPRWPTWGDHYYWSEEYGFRFLRESTDDALDGSNYEIIFGVSTSEIALIYNRYDGHDGETRFFCSADDGNSWGISDFELNSGLYTSATRAFLNTVHLVYNDWEYSYYYPVSKNVIFDDLTAVPEEDAMVPGAFSLSNYPNPFNSSTTISFNLPEFGQVMLEIFDITGRLVRTLADEEMKAGISYLSWDGTDSEGHIVASGVYFYALSFGDKKASNRMLFMK